MRKLLVGVCFVVLAISAVKFTQFAQTERPNQTAKTAQVTENSSIPVEGAQGKLSQELVSESNVIVVGKTIEAKSFWPNPRMLATQVTLDVSEVIKGDQSQSTLTVVIPGGIDTNLHGKFAIQASDPAAATLLPNEEVFLFLTSAGELSAHGYEVTGGPAGKFTIVEDSNGNKFVSSDSISSRQPAAKAARQSSNSVAEQKTEVNGVLLEDFTQQVRELQEANN